MPAPRDLCQLAFASITDASRDMARRVVALRADAYAVYGMPADVVPASLLPPSIVLAPHLVAYVAYDDGGPVATAQALATHGCSFLGRYASPRDTQRPKNHERSKLDPRHAHTVADQ